MKRFTETKKWRDTWFQDLPVKYKLFWLYILDECDEAGVWRPNLKSAQFEIGESFEMSELQRILKDRITILDSGYWFINKFIEFQYGKLSIACKPHAKVISLLNKYGIKNPVSDESIGYLGTLKEEDKDKDQEKDQAQELPFKTEAFEKVWSDWCRHRKEKRQSLTPTSTKQQLKFLASKNEQEAIKIIEQSIQNTWTGLFELKSNTQPTKNRGKLQ